MLQKSSLASGSVVGEGEGLKKKGNREESEEDISFRSFVCLRFM